MQAQIRAQAEAQAAFQTELLAWEEEAKRADERLKLTKDVVKVCHRRDASPQSYWLTSAPSGPRKCPCECASTGPSGHCDGAAAQPAATLT